jgi:cell wall-associated NlpC family hydrolase
MDALIDYAMCFIGKPYIWGGDDPILGFDCSGLVQEILASVGADPRGDQTANGLYRHFRGRRVSQITAGDIAFFGSESRVKHVGFMIDQYRMVEAGGGGSKTLTVHDAQSDNAYIRVRPISNRRDFLAACRPNYLM